MRKHTLSTVTLLVTVIFSAGASAQQFESAGRMDGSNLNPTEVGVHQSLSQPGTVLNLGGGGGVGFIRAGTPSGVETPTAAHKIVQPASLATKIPTVRPAIVPVRAGVMGDGITPETAGTNTGYSNEFVQTIERLSDIQTAIGQNPSGANGGNAAKAKLDSIFGERGSKAPADITDSDVTNSDQVQPPFGKFSGGTPALAGPTLDKGSSRAPAVARFRGANLVTVTRQARAWINQNRWSVYTGAAVFALAGVALLPAKAIVVAALAFAATMGSVFTTGSGIRWPKWAEDALIRDSYQKTIDPNFPTPDDPKIPSRLAISLEQYFLGVGGHFFVDMDPGAAYHAVPLTGYSRPNILLTQDTLTNNSYAFIQGQKAIAEAWFWPSYQLIPNSADKLAVMFARGTQVFAETTRSNVDSWVTDADHIHAGQSQGWFWGFYSRLHQAIVQLTSQNFKHTPYFEFIRDVVAPAISSDPAFQYSLWELRTGVYSRGSVKDGQPIPDNVQRVDQPTHDAANLELYGKNNNGGDVANGPNTSDNFLGSLRNWFAQRGNR